MSIFIYLFWQFVPNNYLDWHTSCKHPSDMNMLDERVISLYYHELNKRTLTLTWKTDCPCYRRVLPTIPISNTYHYIDLILLDIFQDVMILPRCEKAPTLGSIQISSLALVQYNYSDLAGFRCFRCASTRPPRLCWSCSDHVQITLRIPRKKWG